MNAWQNSYIQFEHDILPLLKKYGKEIGQCGSTEAGKIIEAYSLLSKSFDPVSLILLEENLNIWLQNRNSTPEYQI